MVNMRLIVNPAAGSGRGNRHWPQFKEQLKSLGLHYEYDLTEAPGHARELAKSAAQNGYESVVAVGGDGTINEVVNGIFEADALGDVSLGILNAGTGCDCARTLGIPHECKDACERFLNPRKVAVDLGVAEYSTNGQMLKRAFLNNAGLGLDAEVLKTMARRFKVPGRTLRYLAAVIATIVSFKNRDMVFSVDGNLHSQRVCMLGANNFKYLAAGMLFAPGADHRDGLLDVVTIGDLSKPDLLWTLPRVYSGKHLNHSKVTVQKVKELDIKSGDGISIEIDGELVGEPPARFYLLPGALKVII